MHYLVGRIRLNAEDKDCRNGSLCGQVIKGTNARTNPFPGGM